MRSQSTSDAYSMNCSVLRIDKHTCQKARMPRPSRRPLDRYSVLNPIYLNNTLIIPLQCSAHAFGVKRGHYVTNEAQTATEQDYGLKREVYLMDICTVRDVQPVPAFAYFYQLMPRERDTCKLTSSSYDHHPFNRKRPGHAILSRFISHK